MKVSIIIPSFNRAALLERTIASVINQNFHDFEIILVDDASFDNTQDVVEQLSRKYVHHNIKYIRHNINKGEAGARNSGIEVATGQYLAFLDSDDEWLPQKLAEQLTFIEKHNSDGVISEYYLVESDGLNKRHIRFNKDKLSHQNLLTKGCGYGIGTNLLINRSCVKQKFDENLKLFADIDWFYRILKECSISVIHKPLSLYYKSPMRFGDYIKQHAHIFLKKYHQEFQCFSLWSRLRSYSTINWYIAIAYDENKEFKKSLPYYTLGLLQNPFRNIGNYVHIFCLFLKVLIKKT